ncbi:MAG: Snf7 family protein [Nitrososphaerales archaeon]
MSKFTNKWKKPEGPKFKERVKDSVKPQDPLRPRLEQATRQIQVQIGRLDSTLSRLKERDASLFNKVTASLQRHDTQTASSLSNELSEVRKMMKMVSQSKVALEQIEFRLGTVQGLGDVAATLAPVMGIVRSVRSGLVGVMPEAEHEIGEISSILSSILVDAGQLGGLTLNFEVANEDAEKILVEASAVAEQRMKEKFLELPIPTNVSEQAE